MRLLTSSSMFTRTFLILLGLNSAAAAAGVEGLIRRRVESTAVTSVFGMNDVLSNFLSHLSPSDYLTFFMKDPFDRRFSEVLADIQGFARLPSIVSAVEYFWTNNHEEIDLDGLRKYVIHRGGYFTVRKTPEVEAFKVRLLRTAEGFLALREVLMGGIVKDVFMASNLGDCVFTRCFKAVGLLTSLNLRMLNLTGAEVTDLTPVAPLVDITALYLTGTPIVDLALLVPLVNLKQLYLENTRVVDIGPVASLVNLEVLKMTGTTVVDVAPLASLINLEWLWLEGTEVEDLTPLASLDKLEVLYLHGNQADRTLLKQTLLKHRIQTGSLLILG